MNRAVPSLRAGLAAGLACLLLGLPAAAMPPAAGDGFIAEASRGCRVRVSGLTDRATTMEALWDGDCPDGVADGTGRLMVLWREGRDLRGMLYRGPLRQGGADGLGTLVHLRNGTPTIYEAGLFRDDVLVQGRVTDLLDRRIYEGNLRDGLPHGQGALQTGSGAFEGEWNRGCLSLPGGAWTAFLRPPESCGRPEG